MLSTELLERPFPGMEGVVSDSEKKFASKALDSRFVDLINDFRSLDDFMFAGVNNSSENGEKSLIARDFIEGYDIIVDWGLDDKGKTTESGTVFAKNADPNSLKGIVVVDNLKLRKGIMPTARSYDEDDISLPLKRISEIVNGLCTSIIDYEVVGIDPTKALTLIERINPKKVSFISPFNDED